MGHKSHQDYIASVETNGTEKQAKKATLKIQLIKKSSNEGFSRTLSCDLWKKNNRLPFTEDLNI